MTLFDDEYIKELTESETIVGIKKIRNRYNSISQQRGYLHHDLYIEAYTCLKVFMESRGVPFNYSFNITGDKEQNVKHVIELFDHVEEEIVTSDVCSLQERLTLKFSKQLGSGFFYEFSQGDLDRIQNLINDLRGLITETKKLEDDHKRRLFKRLEKLQSELHKKVSDLDLCWGIIMDFGTVIHKLGEDCKPFADRVREIVEVVWSAQNRALDLPSNLPLRLPGEKNTKGKNSNQEGQDNA